MPTYLTPGSPPKSPEEGQGPNAPSGIAGASDASPNLQLGQQEAQPGSLAGALNQQQNSSYGGGAGNPANTVTNYSNQAEGTDSTIGGQALAANTVAEGIPAYNSQIQNAQALQQQYLANAPSALGIQGPQIANLGQGAAISNLAGNASSLGGLANSYGQVASGQGPMGQLAQNQLTSGLAQSQAANLALAHSATGGALGGAAAMRNAQQQNAQAGGALAGQSAILAAGQQQAGLAGEAGALGAQASSLGAGGNLALTQAGQQANLQQQQMAQNENLYQQQINNATQQQQLQAQQLNAQQGEGIQAGLGISGVGVQQQNANTAQLSSYAPYISGAAMGAAALLSDERLKEEVDEEPDEMVSGLMRAVSPKSYRYKDPDDAPAGDGRYLGVMAQDLERVPGLGSKLVQDTPRGKAVNVGAGLSAALAGIGSLHKRLKELEDR